MHLALLAFLGFTAIFWLTYGLRVAYGATQLPWLKDFAPATDAECPAISVLLAARDEEEKLPEALATLVALDYPKLQIVAVDDRSRDATARILDEFARTHPQLRVVHISELPPGWLGKPHALFNAYQKASGEWLVFTDADVRFRPDTLRRAVALARQKQLDHLTLMGDLEMIGVWEKVLITFFGMGFHLATQPDRVPDPKSPSYMGVGAFQMVRRNAYEASGMHRRLAMEVVDDMKLGKIVKQAGFRSMAAVAQDFVVVRWHAGLRNLIHGVTKNFFAAAQFRLSAVCTQLLGLLCMNVAPFVLLPFVRGWALALALISVTIAVGFQIGVTQVMRVSWLYALTEPLGALFFCYMLLRSTVVTLRQGGIVWRDTFYALEELRRGMV